MPTQLLRRVAPSAPTSLAETAVILARGLGRL
jgi:hypothetical protein